MTKKALCVGINDYPFGEENDLRGCVNDANDWANLLKKHFDFTNIKQLLNGDATKTNIVAGIQDLLNGAKAGDILVFTNASHGTYLADTDGDEPKYDEAICPHDTDSNLLVDDDLRELFKNIPKDVRLTVISDSCHSGSVTRVKVNEYRRNRQLNPVVFGGIELSPDQLRAARGKKEKYLESGMKEILLSGCKSNQTSADAYIASDYHGAMSYYAIKAITDANYKLTYADLHKNLVSMLEEENYDQVPQLEGTDEYKNRQAFT
ncbi:MAG TPA: caspase family protein [Pyrinomonadaceae bacterium]|nr:caspase family protein [Pyrinomonadaceae bacterium]